MKVLVDTSYAELGPSGTATYVRGLLAALAELPDVEAIEAARPPRREPGRRAGRRGASGLARSAASAASEAAWLRRGLVERARAGGAELIHHPLPAHAPGWEGAQAITVHDLSFERLPAAFDPLWRAVARRAHLRAARRADVVICVSESTARDVASRWGVPRERIVVAHHGAPPEADDDDFPTQRVTEDPYLLYVGDAEPRKNLALLAAAWRLHREAAPDDKLVLLLAGAGAGELAGEPRVIAVESPSEVELHALYDDARALVHPSLHEGFGLTMLEAMTRGVPVIAARAPGPVELCGGAAAYFDPRDPVSLARRIAEVRDPATALRLAQAARARSQRFGWRESAIRHRDAYTLALAMRAKREQAGGAPGAAATAR